MNTALLIYALTATVTLAYAAWRLRALRESLTTAEAYLRHVERNLSACASARDKATLSNAEAWRVASRAAAEGDRYKAERDAALNANSEGAELLAESEAVAEALRTERDELHAALVPYLRAEAQAE